MPEHVRRRRHDSPTVRATELRCSLCQRWLPDRHFKRNRRYPQRRHRDYYCRACAASYRRAANPGRQPGKRAMVAPGQWRCARCGLVYGADGYAWYPRAGRQSLERSSYCQACTAIRNRVLAKRYRQRRAADPAAMERERERRRRYDERDRQRLAAERHERTAWVVAQTRRHLAAGWTVMRLAAALGVSRRAVACWRDGGSRMGVTRKTEARWCRFLAQGNTARKAITDAEHDDV